MSVYIIPILILSLFIYAGIKKQNCYDVFVEGSKQSFTLMYRIFPYIVAIMISVALFRASGLSNIIIKFISPIFNFFGIPSEVSEMVLLRPLSGSGSFALLKDLISQYGVDSYIGRCAATIMGSSETVFYVTAVYFSGTSVKKAGYVIPVCLVGSLVGAIIACLMCRLI